MQRMIYIFLLLFTLRYAYLRQLISVFEAIIVFLSCFLALIIEFK